MGRHSFIPNKGPIIKDVIIFFFEILDPHRPFRHHFYEISLLSKITFWQLPSPLLDDVFYERPLNNNLTILVIFLKHALF